MMQKNNIELLRKRAGLTRRELGEIVGVYDQTIYCWERGSRNPELPSLLRLADFFEVSLDYLIGRSSA